MGLGLDKGLTVRCVALLASAITFSGRGGAVGSDVITSRAYDFAKYVQGEPDLKR